MRTSGVLLNNFRPILGDPASSAKISGFPLPKSGLFSRCPASKEGHIARRHERASASAVMASAAKTIHRSA
jgi:hypothetical protein